MNTGSSAATKKKLTAETQRTRRFRPWERTHPACRGVGHPVHAGSVRSQEPVEEILGSLQRIFLRALGALRGFAVNPGLDFHREGAKPAKKTRRTLVLKSMKCILFLCSILCCEAHAQTQAPRSTGAAGPRLVKISVFPEQVQLAGNKARQALLVTALYSNGVERDTTSQARFSLKTPGVVEITSQGL